MDDTDPPFYVHELDRVPVDLTEPRHTLEIVAGIFIGSALAAAAAWFWLA
jgi:hypothetical protein